MPHVLFTRSTYPSIFFIFRTIYVSSIFSSSCIFRVESFLCLLEKPHYHKLKIPIIFMFVEHIFFSIYQKNHFTCHQSTSKFVIIVPSDVNQLSDDMSSNQLISIHHHQLINQKKFQVKSHNK